MRLTFLVPSSTRAFSQIANPRTTGKGVIRGPKLVNSIHHAQATKNGIAFRNPFDWAFFGIQTSGTNQLIQCVRILGTRNDSSAVRSPGDPIPSVLGKFAQREINPILD